MINTVQFARDMDTAWGEATARTAGLRATLAHNVANRTARRVYRRNIQRTERELSSYPTEIREDIGWFDTVR